MGKLSEDEPPNRKLVEWGRSSKGVDGRGANPAGQIGAIFREEVDLKIRSFIVAAVAVISSFALLAPAANAAVCYSATVNLNGDTVVNEAGCL